MTAEFGGLAVYNFMRKGLAERMFQRYLKDKELKSKLGLCLGVMPYGGIKLGLVFSFWGVLFLS